MLPTRLSFVALLLVTPARAASEACEVGAGCDATDYETVVVGNRDTAPSLPGHRAGSELGRRELDLRVPRSAPDALRFEPGVFVQQTAHSQGSAFIRGLTGQQTLLLFDGIRLNNGTYRQGPNQYFFTLDSHSVRRLQVVRGGASTRYGSDALGGVVMAVPIEPDLEPGFAWEPHLRLRGATADREYGGRVQLEAATETDGTSPVELIFGGGARRVGRLQSAGPIANPADGEPPLVPRFAPDGRTQRGTGFDEVTGDGRLVWRLSPRHVLTVAAYAYRQFDAPRTDQCPAAHAPFDECLQYDEQFRTLVYAAWTGATPTELAKGFRATLSWQRQHERRSLRRPSAAVVNVGRDTVDTLGLTWVAHTGLREGGGSLRWSVDWGVDTYHDTVASAAWVRFTDIAVTERESRGQYLDGSTYTYGGAFAEATARIGAAVELRLGGRLSWTLARARADADSGSRAIEASWFPLVGHAGVEWKVAPWMSLLANGDRSFRAPNLDDLTSRQQTGPGFQFENPELTPEMATTLEVGLRTRGVIRGEVWGFWMLLDDAVIKSPRPASDCPSATPRCQASWTRFQLVNAGERSEVRGLEASVHARLPQGFDARASLSWIWGEGPNVTDAGGPAVPLSRIPPLNGSVELSWRHALGITASAGLRWAALQDRLALADVADERIPRGGTPGFAVVDLRVSYRWGDQLLVSIALENLLDAAYRYHGSSVNGPGRGLVVLLDVGPAWR